MDDIEQDGIENEEDYVKNRIKVRGGGTYVILSEYALNPKASTKAILDYLKRPGNKPPQTGKVVTFLYEERRR